MIGHKEIKLRFTYHPPTSELVKTMERVRNLAKELALEMDKCSPDSREKSLALTKVEEAVMHFNSGLVRRS